jgi:protein-tyrosine kinase
MSFTEKTPLKTQDTQPMSPGFLRRPLKRLPGSAQHRVILDRAGLRAAGLMVPDADVPTAMREYRQIKQPLIANALGRNRPVMPKGRLIMISSALPNDGKTFTALNLAFSMAAEKDVHVVLADGDFAKPHISRSLGIQEQPGLLDALRDSTLDLETLILPTDLPSLSVLPAGTPCDNITELLTSTRMQDLLRSMTEQDTARIVLFDSSPMLLTSEASALARNVGQVVLVVRAGGTPQRAVLDAVSHVSEHPSVSLILNQCVSNASQGYYYYGNSYPDRTGRGASS